MIQNVSKFPISGDHGVMVRALGFVDFFLESPCTNFCLFLSISEW